MDVRERSKDPLSRHGLAGFAAAVTAKVAWFFVLAAARTEAASRVTPNAQTSHAPESP
jgi:hypothetical protein